MVEKIKYRIISILKIVFHYLGFTIERIPHPNRLYDDLKDAHEPIQIHELKKITRNIKLANNHKLYNQILKKYVPHWNDDFSTVEFVGKGSGEYTFDVYRKVCYKKRCYFEKVYFSNSYDFRRMKWFYKNIFPLLTNKLETTKLVNIAKGELISIAYFEFLELVPVEKPDWYSVFMDVSKTLIKLTPPINQFGALTPDFLKNYRLHDQYMYNAATSSNTMLILTSNRLSTSMIEKTISLGPLLLTHGDMCNTNVYKNNYVIDWDSFGFFPHGFETAVILTFVPLTLTFDELKKKIAETYKDVIDRNHWDSFQLSFLYFYFVFIARYEKSMAYDLLQKSLASQIEELYHRINLDRSQRTSN